MNTLTKFMIPAGLAIALAGCAGESVVAASGTRGEGNIPVGKVVEPVFQRSRVTITEADGSVVAVDSNEVGQFLAAQAPFGRTHFKVQPYDPALPSMEFEAVLGIEQEGVFIANPVVVPQGTTVDNINIEFLGRPTIRVGQTVPIKITVNGKNANQLRPLVWLDGGVGRLNPGNNFVATYSGPGAVNATILGVTARLEFHVHPMP